MKWPSEIAKTYEEFMNEYFAEFYVDDVEKLKKCRVAFETIIVTRDLAYAKQIANQALNIMFEGS